MIYCTKGGEKRREIIEDCFIQEQPEAGEAVKRGHVGECDGSTTSHELVAEEGREGAVSSHWEKVPREGENSHRQVGGNPHQSFGHHIGLALPVESLVCAAENLVSNPSF